MQQTARYTGEASVLDTTFALNNTMTALKTASGFFRHLHAEH